MVREEVLMVKPSEVRKAYRRYMVDLEREHPVLFMKYRHSVRDYLF